MGRRKSGETKEKRTPIKIRPIVRKHAGKITEPWAIMERLISECPFFEPLKAANIKLWWQKDWKADVDLIATGAQVCKASEIDRNLVEEGGGETPDMFIKLPESQWPTLEETEKEHRIFHELCHIKPAKDSNGKQKRDAKERLLWRLGRHPIAAFHEEIERYGIDRVLGHNEAIAAAMSKADRPMEKVWDAAEKKAPGPGQAEKASGNGQAVADWRKLPIEELGLLAGKCKRLRDAGLVTLGAIQDRVKEKGDFWWQDIKNVGEGTAEEIAERFMQFFQRHPEACEA